MRNQDHGCIADQCPLAGGKAVFEARALYSKFEDVEYDDQAACALVGITMREMQEREQSEIDFTLDPNPADARVTISSITGTLSGIVSILDINGRTLWTDHLKEAQQKIIPTATFPAGVYCCRIKTTNEQVLIRTFIITH